MLSQTLKVPPGHRGARSGLIDELVTKAANALGEAFRNLRACSRLDGSRADTRSLSATSAFGVKQAPPNASADANYEYAP
jgi:hypothetical protein